MRKKHFLRKQLLEPIDQKTRIPDDRVKQLIQTTTTTMTFKISNVPFGMKHRPRVFYLSNVFFMPFYLVKLLLLNARLTKTHFFLAEDVTTNQPGAFRDRNLTTAIIILHFIMHNAHFTIVSVAIIIIMTVIKIIICNNDLCTRRKRGWRVSHVLMFIPTPTPQAPPPPAYSSSTYFPPTLPNRITICGATDGRRRDFYDVHSDGGNIALTIIL